MDLNQFADKMDKFCVELPKNAAHLTKRVASDIHANIVVSTPVKTGKARSNWLIGLGSPDKSVVDTHGVEGSIGVTLANAASVIARQKPEQAIYINNNVYYIGRLNAGSSVQAPAEFVQKAMAIAVTTLGLNKRIITKGL